MMPLKTELGLPNDIGNLANEAAMNIAFTADLLAKEADRLFRPHGLTSAQFNVLMLLKHQAGRDGLTQTRLGEMLLVHRSNVTGLVDRMEREGWVERRPAPGDRRVNLIALTGAGRRLAERTGAAYDKRLDAVFGALSGKEQQTVCVLMERLRERLRDVSRA